MLILRRILVLLLSLSVPTTVLASLMDTGHCHSASLSAAVVSADAAASHSAPDLAININDAHAHHGMQTDTAGFEPTDSSASLASADQIDCQCGCNCSTTHCATGGAALAVIADFDNRFSPGLTQKLGGFGPTRTIAAHGLDILRPPCTG